MNASTKASDTQLLVHFPTTTGIDLNPTWYGTRAKGESATENIETVVNGEFSATNDVTGKIVVGADAQNPFNINLTGDTAERKIMEWELNGEFDADNILKSGNVNKLMATRRILTNDEGSFITDTLNCVNATSVFSIVAKQLNMKNITPNGTHQIIRDVQLGYQDDGTYNDIFGGHNSVWLNDSTGLLYKRTLRNYSATALNVDDAFSAEEQWSAITEDPTVSTGTAQWLLNTTDGGVWLDDGTLAPELIFTWMPYAWFSGTDEPSSSVGGRDSLYLRTGDGSETYHADIWQKINNGKGENVWTKIMNWNTESIGAKWYQGNTITAKSTNAEMSFPYLQNLVFNGVIGTKCVDDLTFTIDNTATPQDGKCTSNIGVVSPNYRAIDIARGLRKITGAFTAQFYNDELQKLKHEGTEFYTEFLLSNGTQAYRIQMMSGVFDGGDPQATNAEDPSVKQNLTYELIYNSTYGASIIITYIPDIDDYPPLYWGWVTDPASITAGEIAELSSMTNYFGNFEVPVNPGSKYFVICTPATEQAIASLINTDTNIDELSDYAEAVATQELVSGTDYNVNTSADTSTVPTAGDIYIINR